MGFVCFDPVYPNRNFKKTAPLVDTIPVFNHCKAWDKVLTGQVSRLINFYAGVLFFMKKN